jgi:hypothetical protein
VREVEAVNLRDAARDQSCVRCGAHDGTVVGAHYTGARRLAFGGGLGRKVHDLCIAHLCAKCHSEMDCTSRDKETKWEHSEEFLFLILLTQLRLWEQGVITASKPSR